MNKNVGLLKINCNFANNSQLKNKNPFSIILKVP